MHMKKLTSFHVVILIVIATMSCNVFAKRIEGNGHVTTEQRHIRQVKKIKLLGSMDVILAIGEPSIRVEADENVLPYIETEVDGDWLEIKTREHFSIHTSHDIKVYVTTPTITHVGLFGSGNVTASGELVSNSKIDFDIAGSGDISMNINTPQVKANIGGSGSLQLTGETRDINLNIAGSGSFDAENLKAENAKVSIAGSGDAHLYADVKLKVDIMGSGSVTYKGNAIVNKNVMGSGTISKLP
jgi:hypothetical protein